jgi:hypothetical protein
MMILCQKMKKRKWKKKGEAERKEVHLQPLQTEIRMYKELLNNSNTIKLSIITKKTNKI